MQRLRGCGPEGVSNVGKGIWWLGRERRQASGRGQQGDDGTERYSYRSTLFESNALGYLPEFTVVEKAAAS